MKLKRYVEIGKGWLWKKFVLSINPMKCFYDINLYNENQTILRTRLACEAEGFHVVNTGDALPSPQFHSLLSVELLRL